MMTNQMRINIIYKPDGWIIERMALELIAGLGADSNLPVGVCDVDYFLPYDRFQDGSKFSVGYFTHLEQKSKHDAAHMERKREKFKKAAASCSRLIVMNRMLQQVLGGTIIKPASSLHKKVKFGVCGRAYKSGRKNEKFIQGLFAAGVDIVACGKGWNIPTVNDTPELYGSIDYLIIPSSNEGGPVPMLEALNCGVPVIAPDVGFCFDYPVIKYEKNNYADLLRVVLQLSTPRLWIDWVNEHKIFFSGLENEKNKQLVFAGK